MDMYKFAWSFFRSKHISLIIAFLCWKKDKQIEIWRSGHLMGIRVNIQTDFYELPELPAYDVYREGILVDLECPGIELVLQKASNNRAFIHRYTWLLLTNSSLDNTEDNILSETMMLPDSDVSILRHNSLLDVYRIKANQPLLVTNLGVNYTASEEKLHGLWGSLPSAAVRRKNLMSIYLSSAIILSQPQHFKGWNDLLNRHVDTFPKVTYPLMKLLAEDLNFRYNLHQIDEYGVEQNGSFDGLVGRLQRREVEIGISSMFLRADRWRVLHFSAETIELKSAIVFRQPPQSAVSNIYLLPFSRGVWLASMMVVMLSGVLLALLAIMARYRDDTLKLITMPEVLTFCFGCVCQQGFHVSPRLASARLVMFAATTASLFAFTAYSAKVVALLQAPSSALRTLDDITKSPIDVGVQETTYKKVYFAESKDPKTQRLYRRKLLPQGDKAYLSVVDGIQRVRTGLFAFQVEESSGYDIISKTFTEPEKCSVSQIQAFKLPMVCVPIVKHSGYRELVATRLRWQREIGIMSKWRRVWMTSKSVCSGGNLQFVSVRLRDVAPVLQMLGAGLLLAFAEMVVERISSRLPCTRRYNTVVIT